MKKMATTFLTEEEQRQVTQAVQQAEKKSSGEIVPMIVSRSYSYPLASHWGAFVLGLFVSLVLVQPCAALLQLRSSSYLVFLVLFIIAYLLFNKIIPLVPSLHRVFITGSDIEEEVQEGAITSFFQEQLYKTAQENGVLLYISVFEQKVWVLGDAGVNAVIEESYWEDIVSRLTIAIKRGQRCQGICEAVESIGKTLAQHFPVQEDDKDELHNLIIRE